MYSFIILCRLNIKKEVVKLNVFTGDGGGGEHYMFGVRECAATLFQNNYKLCREASL